MDVPVAVQRKRYMDSSGPSLLGVTRLDKVVGPGGEVFTFLGSRDGIVYLQRDDKTKGPAFVEVDSSDFRHYPKQR
jgi:hypothetical protein